LLIAISVRTTITALSYLFYRSVIWGISTTQITNSLRSRRTCDTANQQLNFYLFSAAVHFCKLYKYLIVIV